MNKTAADVMTRDIATVDPEWPVEQLMDFLSNRSISGAPVVTADGAPIGVVSLTDIARNGSVLERSASTTSGFYRESLEGQVAHEELGRFHVDADAQTTVRDIMTPVVFSVEEDTTVQQVAEMMITGRIHRVVVKRAGKMTGIITSMDLLPLVRDQRA